MSRIFGRGAGRDGPITNRIVATSPRMIGTAATRSHFVGMPRSVLAPLAFELVRWRGLDCCRRAPVDPELSGPVDLTARDLPRRSARSDVVIHDRSRCDAHSAQSDQAGD